MICWQKFWLHQNEHERGHNTTNAETENVPTDQMTFVNIYKSTFLSQFNRLSRRCCCFSLCLRFFGVFSPLYDISWTWRMRQILCVAGWTFAQFRQTHSKVCTERSLRKFIESSWFLPPYAIKNAFENHLPPTRQIRTPESINGLIECFDCSLFLYNQSGWLAYNITSEPECR